MIKKRHTVIIIIVLITILLVGFVIVFFDKKIKSMDKASSVLPIETKNRLSPAKDHSVL